MLRSLGWYLFVGAIATGVDWALFAFFVFVLDWHYMAGGSVSFILATYAGYLAGLRLVFRRGQRGRMLEITYIYIASLVGLIIHAASLAVLVSWLDTHLFVAKMIATGVTFLWNFAARYFWIYDQRVSNA